MALVGNRKQLMSLLLLCIITSAVTPPWTEAQVTCPDINNALLPCESYIYDGGAIPSICCDAMRTMEDGLDTNQDRQSACQCLKETVSEIAPDQLKRAHFIPSYCEVPLSFPISPDVDCSSIPKRID